MDICRNCQGTGRVIPSERELKPIEITRPDICPVCAGSGRVVKTLNIKITIEPYRKE